MIHSYRRSIWHNKELTIINNRIEQLKEYTLNMCYDGFNMCSYSRSYSTE